MQSYRQSKIFRLSENAFDLVGRESNVLAKPVDSVSKTFLVSGFQRRDAYIVYIVVLASGIVGRQGMSAQKTGLYPHRSLRFNQTRGSQHRAFRGNVQAIARFDFNRRNAFGDESVDSGKRLLHKLVGGFAARRLDGRNNSASGP